MKSFSDGIPNLFRFYGFPFVYFSASTLLMTWPLPTHLATHVIGEKGGDNWYYIWLIGWFEKALFELKQNPLFVQSHNYPLGWNLAYSEVTPLTILTALPVSLISGPVLAYNFVSLLSFVLSGLIVYWWVTSLTKNAAAGLVSGTLFAFAPYRLAHVYGHLPLLGTQYLALHYAGLYFLLQQRFFNWKYAIIAGIGLGLASLSSMYYLYMSLIVSTIIVLGYIFIAERQALARGVFWQNLLASALIALPIVILAVFPYLQLGMQGNANHRLLGEVDEWSASLPDFFLPAPVHIIWGKWVFTHFDRSLWIEQTVYIGMIGLFLSGYALINRKKAPIKAWVEKLLVFGIVCGMILAMGTSLHWFRQQVTITVPEIVQRWVPKSKVPIYLPNYFLFNFLPFYDGMRVWMRYGIYVNLFAAVLAGIGFARLIQSIKAKNHRMISNLVLLMTIVLIGIDFYIAPFPLSEVEVRPVDLWLAAQSDEDAVVQFPIELSIQPELIYATLIHSKPFLGMYYGAYLPYDFFQRIYPILKKFPDKKSVKLIHEKGAEYILVDESKYLDWEGTKQAIESFGLSEIVELDGQHVFRFEAP